jgi:uncharacterized phiE125 gp8 family phage protein
MISLITPPGAEPIELLEAKKHLRVQHSLEDDLITGHIVSAREDAELYTWRAFLTQTWRYYLDRFPCGTESIELPKPPLLAVTSVTYLDAAGVTQTWASSEYSVLAPAGPEAPNGCLFPKVGKRYPSTACQPGAVSIDFNCGYGGPAALPKAIRSAMFIRISELYERREESTVGTIVSPNPNTFERLLRRFRAARMIA